MCRQLAKLQQRQIKAMDRACGSLGAGVTDDQINELAGRHIKETNKVETHYENEIRLLQETQRKEYSGFVESVFSAEKSITDDVPKNRWRSNYVEEEASDTAKEDKSKSMFGMAKSWTKKLRGQGEEIARPSAVQVVAPDVSVDEIQQAPRLQESFTVQLGTQQKATHNMRLLSGMQNCNVAIIFQTGVKNCDLRCVLRRTEDAGCKTRLEFRIKKLKPPFYHAQHATSFRKNGRKHFLILVFRCMHSSYKQVESKLKACPSWSMHFRSFVV